MLRPHGQGRSWPYQNNLEAARTCTVPKVFFDTNILVYQMDKKSSTKKEKCRSLIRKAANDGDAVISTQVLQGILCRSDQQVASCPSSKQEHHAYFRKHGDRDDREGSDQRGD